MTCCRALLFALSFPLLCACGGGSDDGPPQPILAVDGTIGVGDRQFVPGYGASNVRESGTVSVLFSDKPISCSTIYTTKPPPDGTYVAVQVPSVDKGIASEHMVLFTILDHGDIAGGGSNKGTVEVLDASDSTISIRVAYEDARDDTTYAVNGDFTVTRCP